jgi:uncharacterized RDD family membrane protein YckC
MGKGALMSIGSESEPDHEPTRVPAGRLLSRAVARMIDAIILGVVGVALGLALDFRFVWLALQAVLVFAYFVVLDVTRGTTIGKGLLGLKVTGPHGGAPTVRVEAFRVAFTLLGAIPYACGFLAFIAWIVIAVTIHSSPTGQGKHDELAGGTRVVTA